MGLGEQVDERLTPAVLSGDAFGTPAPPAGGVLRRGLSRFHVPADPGQAGMEQRRQVLEPLGGHGLDVELVVYVQDAAYGTNGPKLTRISSPAPRLNLYERPSKTIRTSAQLGISGRGP